MSKLRGSYFFSDKLANYCISIDLVNQFLGMSYLHIFAHMPIFFCRINVFTGCASKILQIQTHTFTLNLLLIIIETLLIFGICMPR